MIISYASTNIREVCENHAASVHFFTSADLKLIRAVLSDISAAAHVGEIIGMRFDTLNETVLAGSKAILTIRLGLDLRCTLNSSLKVAVNCPVRPDTIRRLKIDSIGAVI